MLDQLMLIGLAAILFSFILLIDYIDELKKQKRNGKKSR